MFSDTMLPTLSIEQVSIGLADMWRPDPHGTPLDDDDAAREELRRRAWLAIGDGLRRGHDVRHLRVRVRSEDGRIVFEGTLAEAVANNGQHPASLAVQHGEAVVSASRRLQREAERNRQALFEERQRLSEVMLSLTEELRVAEQLMEASRRHAAWN